MSDEELIDGIYKLVMCIATGGSSQVWECVEQSSGRHLAMKLLKQDVEKEVFKEKQGRSEARSGCFEDSRTSHDRQVRKVLVQS